MTLVGIIIIVTLAMVFIFFLSVLLIYNKFIKSRLRVEEAWSTIAVQLKRRADLVPNLVETVKGYAAHEQDTLTDVIHARSMIQDAHGPIQTAEADNILTQALGRLFAIAESYPQLKASENFILLQKDLYDIEEKIAYARQFYNRNVLDFNTQINLFPQSIIAAIFRFEPKVFFESDETQANVGISFRKP